MRNLMLVCYHTVYTLLRDLPLLSGTSLKTVQTELAHEDFEAATDQFPHEVTPNQFLGIAMELEEQQ
jgi:hypothetical protein